MNYPNTRRDNWSAYWRQGALHSLSSSFHGGYGGSIHRFWSDVFTPLRADGRVLDIGTGNGPLPALLCELHGDAVPGVEAVDLATVSPAWLKTARPACRERIRFYSGTSAEALPFADHSFDLAVSQYGLEYSRLDKSIAELARAVRPDGQLALIMHHANSRLAEVAGEECRLIDALLAEDGLMPAAAGIFPYLAKAGRGQHAELAADPGASLARSRFNAAMQALATLAGQSPFPDVTLETRDFVGARIEGLMQARLSEKTALADLNDHAQALCDSRFRSEELRHHALDEAAMQAFRQRLDTQGFGVVGAAPIHHQSLLLGWSLRARRN